MGIRSYGSLGYMYALFSHFAAYVWCISSIILIKFVDQGLHIVGHFHRKLDKIV